MIYLLVSEKKAIKIKNIYINQIKRRIQIKY